VKKEAGNRAKMGLCTPLDSIVSKGKKNNPSFLGDNQNVFALETAFPSVVGR
jgi:hypothetical protein